MQERANDRRFLSTICFTDESTFKLNNEPNVQIRNIGLKKTFE
jgi:hypothetical protein